MNEWMNEGWKTTLAALSTQTFYKIISLRLTWYYNEKKKRPRLHSSNREDLGEVSGLIAVSAPTQSTTHQSPLAVAHQSQSLELHHGPRRSVLRADQKR